MDRLAARSQKFWYARPVLRCRGIAWEVEQGKYWPCDSFLVLDDALVEAALKLLQRDDCIPDASLIADELYDEYNFRAFSRVGLYCLRSIQFLREVAIRQSGEMLVQKCLQTS